MGAETPAVEPLFHAIRKADTTAVKRLLDHGVSPDAQDAEGTPALMEAALYANADCIKLLLVRAFQRDDTDIQFAQMDFPEHSHKVILR